ncbi:MAG: glycosyltransferase family 9 protein [Phycisphaerales bacterium]|nr:MAG: glycosyltransferase family 9 protein [Phycisphaerales bacterium]
MTSPERILIVRPSALGDVCRSVPVLASLRAALPEARIDWLVQDGFADGVRAHPALDGVVEFPRKRLGRMMRRGNLPGVIGWLNSVRRARYDLVLDCQGLARSGIITRWTGAKQRVGDAGAREGARLAYTHRVDTGAIPHTVDKMLALLEPVGVPLLHEMRLFAPAEDAERAAGDSRFAGRFAVIAPTSRWAGKRWPAERFAAVARSLLWQADGCGVERVVLVGGPGEREQCGPLLELAASDDRVVDLIGRTSVGAMMAAIERSSLVLACDSAALHIAVGFDRPIVGLYGPTDVSKVGPYRRENDVIQHTRDGDVLDHKDERVGTPMMERITAEEVIDACLERLG